MALGIFGTLVLFSAAVGYDEYKQRLLVKQYDLKRPYKTIEGQLEIFRERTVKYITKKGTNKD